MPVQNDLILVVIQCIILIGSYLVGRYLIPNIQTPEAKETIQDVIAKTDLIINYADKFVSWAKEFKKKSTGAEKMQAVVEQLTMIAQQNGIDMSQEQITAIAQKAYDSMKTGIEAAENDKIRAEASQNATTIIVPPSQPLDSGVDNTLDTTITCDTTTAANNESDKDPNLGFE